VSTEDGQFHVHHEIPVGAGQRMSGTGRHVAEAHDRTGEFGAEHILVEHERFLG